MAFADRKEETHFPDYHLALPRLTRHRQKIFWAYKYDLSIGISRRGSRIRDWKAGEGGDQERR